MAEIDKYYKDIIDKVNKLIEEKKYDEAIEILEDELDAPYIPISFQTKMEEILLTVHSEKNYFKQLYDVEHLNRKQLFQKIYENNKFNFSALHLFFERYNNNLTNEELYGFEDLFISRKLDNETKTTIFEALAYEKINHNFRYYNSNIKDEFEVNPTKTVIFEEIPLYKETKKMIDDLASKEPSLLNFCFNILLSIYKYYFPLHPNYDYKELSESIFRYMMNTLQGEKVSKNEITELIEKIINSTES